MPRCYMVKKDPSPLGGTPPCSPTEASVAPPCYTPHDHNLAGPRAAQYAEPRHVGTQYEEPRSGDFAEKSGGESTAPCGALHHHRAVRYLEREPAAVLCHPAEYEAPDGTKVIEYEVVTEEFEATEYRPPEDVEHEEYRPPEDIQHDEYRSHEDVEHDEYRPREDIEHEEYRSAEDVELAEYPPPDHIEYAPQDDVEPTEYVPTNDESSEYPAPDDGKRGEYAELQNMGGAVVERSAADTEAAHELLSLAAGVPPLPAVLTVLGAPDPVLPVYTYALQPTSIYIIADDPPANNVYATAVQTLTPLQQVEYPAQPQVSTYIIQEPAGAQYRPVYAAESEPAAEAPSETGVPVSVIETAPAAEPAPQSVQVPVIEPVPRAPPAAEPPEETDSDESVPLATVSKKNKYNCNECGKRYATSSNLSRHKQTHRSLDSQAAKRCAECGKAYVSMPALAMHVLTHRMGYVCGVCGKQFSRPWLLRGHLRSHTGEKPYNCPSCSKSFADRSNLRAHLQTHAADKRWECSRCNKTFALKSYLNKHQEAACGHDDDN